MGRKIRVGDRPVTIGRSSTNDIVIGEPGVSRQHATVRRTPDGLELRDEASSNGSFVNGQRVERATLAVGDTIRIGSQDLTVTRHGVRLSVQASAAVDGPMGWGSGIAIPFAVVLSLLVLAFALRNREPVGPPEEPATTEPIAVAAKVTDTASPRATLTPVAIVAAGSTATRSPAGLLTVSQPVADSKLDGVVRFAWQAEQVLAANETFDVRVCRGAGCQPTYGKVNTRAAEWEWCPTEGAGVYRWQVVVVDVRTKQRIGGRSVVMDFEWSGGCSVARPDRETEEPDGGTGTTAGGDTPTAPGKGMVTPRLP